jgi:hypothetical protein
LDHRSNRASSPAPRPGPHRELPRRRLCARRTRAQRGGASAGADGVLSQLWFS